MAERERVYIEREVNALGSEEIGHERHEIDQQARRGRLSERRILIIDEGDVESWQGEKGVDKY